MSKGYEKRKNIFEKYVHQLKTLKRYGLLPRTINFNGSQYICPICLGAFSREDLNETSGNMLTLEDSPPKSLGGRANTLTCKNCNNKCGHKIDFHLTERLIELDIRAFHPNSTSKAKLSHKGIKVQGEVKVDKEGKISVIHSKKNNNPEKLSEYVSSTGHYDIVEIEFKSSRVEKLRLEVALLKTAYLLAFEQYGYSLILNRAYDIVREQLKNPDIVIYPEGFWTKQGVLRREHEGVHLIAHEEYEGFISIYTLETSSSENRFAVYLPINEKKTKEIISRLARLEAGFGLKFNSYMENDYFGEDENMIMMSRFMKNKNTP